MPDHDRKVEDLTASTYQVQSPRDILDLVGRGVSGAILLEHQLGPGFFDLSSGLAGEVVQKCMNYGLRVAIVTGDRGSWSMHFAQFADESTRHGRFVFVSSVDEALAKLGR